MELRRKATLYFMCGKMAAGKSTLSRELAERVNAVLIVQDDFLERLYPGEIVDIAWLREILDATEGCPHAACLHLAIRRRLGRTRLSGQHEKTASLVSGPVRELRCRT